MNVKGLILAGIVSTTISCQSVKKDVASFDNYPVREGKLTEISDVKRGFIILIVIDHGCCCSELIVHDLLSEVLEHILGC